MRSVITTALLASLFLNAGAFATDNRAYLRAKDANITVMTKNQAWPVPSRMTLEPCTEAACFGV
jgi:hypothetical protein